jgi:hypothetical protein
MLLGMTPVGFSYNIFERPHHIVFFDGNHILMEITSNET